MAHEGATKVTAAAQRTTDSELGIELLGGVQADSAYPIADGIWMTECGSFLAESGTVVCDLKLRPFAA